jgi:hypothetical protein
MVLVPSVEHTGEIVQGPLAICQLESLIKVFFLYNVRNRGKRRRPWTTASQEMVCTAHPTTTAATLTWWVELEDAWSAAVVRFGVPPSGGPGPRKRGTPNRCIIR